jgi:hypothetical protein
MFRVEQSVTVMPALAVVFRVIKKTIHINENKTLSFKCLIFLHLPFCHDVVLLEGYKIVDRCSIVKRMPLKGDKSRK